MYIARDLNNTFWLFTSKPIRAGNTWNTSDNDNNDCLMIDSSFYSDITFENSPVECSIMPNDYLQNMITETYEDGYQDGYHEGLIVGREEIEED